MKVSKRRLLAPSLKLVCVAGLALSLYGCNDGTDGTNGTNGTDGTDGTNGLTTLISSTTVDPGDTCAAGGTLIQSGLDLNGDGILDASEVTSEQTICNGTDGSTLASSVSPEQCETCHSNDGFDRHVSDYAQYNDASTLALSITNVQVTDTSGVGTGPFDLTVDVHVTQNGVAYNDEGWVNLKQKTFYTTTYDSTNADVPFTNSVSLLSVDRNTGVATNLDSTDRVNGNYSFTKTGLAVDPTTHAGYSGAQIYGYIAANELNTETKDLEGTSVHLYSDVASTAQAFGDVASYDSAANVAACQKCHGTPYRKHGYREAAVAGLSDFSSCKNCHYDDRNGGHRDWQQMLDNPRAWADGVTADPVTYAYKATLMNDVHMSHSMEFPYPQSMGSCTNCHEGKLDRILDNSNFRLAVCKSCHAINGPAVYDPADEVAQDFVSKRAPSLMSLWTDTTNHPDLTLIHSGVNDSTDCTQCHQSGGTGLVPARALNEMHTGYNPVIYAADGTKYNDAITVTIDSITAAGNVLTISFHADEDPAQDTPLSVSDIVPNVYVALYGYDTKDFIVSNHTRDAAGNRYEYVVGTDHPYFTTVSSGGGAWVVTADITAELALAPAGSVKRAEVAIAPQLNDADGNIVALDAPSSTFDLTTGLVDNAFYHASEIVKVDGCNTCHDALATTFHSPIRGGNITVCRMCHVPTNGGSHLEMQSRSIDSYVHAVHSFQEFDIDQVDFTDNLEALAYEHHIGHTFPNFTIKNCYACHNEGTNEVPDQTKTMAGIISASESHATLASHGFDRNIGDVPAYVTGPAGRACGGCHRAQMIKADDASKLASFYQHKSLFGYLVEDAGDTLLEVVQAIAAFFD